jgi:hypothetical protein
MYSKQARCRERERETDSQVVEVAVDVVAVSPIEPKVAAVILPENRLLPRARRAEFAILPTADVREDEEYVSTKRDSR